MDTHRLTVTWTTSRGYETAGWNVATLREDGRYIARTKGGGYDMRGTVFGEWLERTYQEDLRALRATVKTRPYAGAGWVAPDRDDPAAWRLYGLTWGPDGRASLDGGCGMSSMERIAASIGLDVTTIDASRKVDVIIVTRAAPALAVAS